VGEEKEWQQKALRLQAEMDNFRKRQARRADEAIAAERERLLNLFLPAVDNLERALAQPQETNGALRQGVELTHREIMRRLEGEGVTRLETLGQLLDPELHEAVAAIPAQAESGVIVKELEAGYKLGDKLLRPARVVVAA
jgi:molecular chaperone GrpE